MVLRHYVLRHPYELSNLGCRYWYVDSAMFDSLKLFSSTHVTSTDPIAPKSIDFRVLGVKTPLGA
jgi:hypothetical protein